MRSDAFVEGATDGATTEDWTGMGCCCVRFLTGLMSKVAARDDGRQPEITSRDDSVPSFMIGPLMAFPLTFGAGVEGRSGVRGMGVAVLRGGVEWLEEREGVLGRWLLPWLLDDLADNGVL